MATRSRKLAAQFLALAEKQGRQARYDRASRLMGVSLLLHRRHCGRASASRSGDRALRPSRASSVGDAIWPRHQGVAILAFRSLALWVLGYPEAALADARRALKDAREIGHAATLMYALARTTIVCPYSVRKLRGSESAAR